MFQNYFAAWRNLIRSKVHSAINITGLSVGMAVAILIGLARALKVNDNRCSRPH
jgi:hypothetical protein